MISKSSPGRPYRSRVKLARKQQQQQVTTTGCKQATNNKPVVCSEVNKSKFLFNPPHPPHHEDHVTPSDDDDDDDDDDDSYQNYCDVTKPMTRHGSRRTAVAPPTTTDHPVTYGWSKRTGRAQVLHRHDHDNDHVLADVIDRDLQPPPPPYSRRHRHTQNRTSHVRRAYIATKYLPTTYYTLLPTASTSPSGRILVSSVKRISGEPEGDPRRPFVVLSPPYADVVRSSPLKHRGGYHGDDDVMRCRGGGGGGGYRLMTSSGAEGASYLLRHRFEDSVRVDDVATMQRRRRRMYHSTSGNRLPQNEYDGYHGYPSTAGGRLALHSTFPPPGGNSANGGYYPVKKQQQQQQQHGRPMTLGMTPSSLPPPQRQTANPQSTSSYGGGGSPNQSDSSQIKPKVVTVVRAGNSRPHKKITILLNRRAVQTYEQLVADISEALGQPKWKNDHIRKLFTLKGREVKSVSDFFREDDCFIAVGREQLATSDIQDVLHELYPDSPYAESLIQRNLERNFRQQQQRQQNTRRRNQGPMKGSKSDSGLGDSTEGERIRPSNHKARASHLLSERRRFQEEERLKAKKWEKERWTREQEEINKDINRRRCISQDSVGGLLSPPIAHGSPEARFTIESTTRGRGGGGGGKKKAIMTSSSSPLRHHLAWDDPEVERKKDREEERRRRRIQEEEDESRRRLDEEEEKERERLRREREAIEREKMKLFEEERLRKEKEEAEKNRRARDEEDRRRKREEDDRAKKRLLEEDRKKKLHEAEERRRREEELQKEKKKIEEERRKLEEEKKRIREDEEKRTKEMRELEEKAKKSEEKRREAELAEEAKKAASSSGGRYNKSDDNDKLKRAQKLKAPPRRLTTRGNIEARYEIGKTIGDGNFAIVRESRLRNTESEYAMKIIDKSKLKGKEEMIENEIAIMKNCHHPNIVRLIEEFETNDEIYLVLEYIKGGDLFDAITESIKFTERDAANMVADLCEALAFLHSKNIIHRDLKPENLLVSRNKDGSMTLKLADFGLAMEVREPIYTVCGTPTYVAPEILAETGYGLEVDMWAAGVITYILLCGFPPFRSVERDQEELFEVIQLGDYEFLSPYWDNISDAAKDLIQRLLVVDTKRRYTAEQVLAHPWIQSEGTYKGPNLQREITMNLEKNFGDRRRRPLRSQAVQ